MLEGFPMVMAKAASCANFRGSGVGLHVAGSVDRADADVQDDLKVCMMVHWGCSVCWHTSFSPHSLSNIFTRSEPCKHSPQFECGLAGSYSKSKVWYGCLEFWFLVVWANMNKFDEVGTVAAFLNMIVSVSYRPSLCGTFAA
jgi:hypothetical protein